MYCVLQYLKIIESKNIYFQVTGTWVNPNVSAIFLALTGPVFFILLKYNYKKITLTCFGFIIIALVLLKCRTAYIGISISAIVYFGLQNNYIQWLRNNKNKISIKIISTLILLIVVTLGITLYKGKKASADGRKFVWKTSSEMIIKRPFFGYGYGRFEKEYNLFQAEKIQKRRSFH
ncbi:MAG: O-antigen ligase family protein [Flavobacterium sp.]|nr:O-antigen ligase family protein [Flavobacterium sp.]